MTFAEKTYRVENNHLYVDVFVQRPCWALRARQRNSNNATDWATLGTSSRANGGRQPTFRRIGKGDGGSAPADPLISAGRVFGIAAILGAINIVLLSALATVSAFIYNVSADLAGGLEVTLSERE